MQNALAGLFVGLALLKEAIEAGKAIGMHGPGIVREMIDRVCTLAVCTELIPGTGWGLAAPRAPVVGRHK